MNTKPQLERARCQHDGYLIGPDGKCWFCGEKFAERIPLHLVSTHSQPKVEVEMSVSEQQLLLSEELFARYEVESVTISVSGGCKIAADMMGMIAADGLEPGQDVIIVCRGHVKDVSAPYQVRDRKYSGRLVLAVEVVESVREVRQG